MVPLGKAPVRSQGQRARVRIRRWRYGISCTSDYRIGCLKLEPDRSIEIGVNLVDVRGRERVEEVDVVRSVVVPIAIRAEVRIEIQGRGCTRDRRRRIS